MIRLGPVRLEGIRWQWETTAVDRVQFWARRNYGGLARGHLASHLCPLLEQGQL